MANVNFTKEMIEEQLRKFSAKAESLLGDKEKIRELLKKARDFAAKGKNLPVIGGIIDDIVTMVDLIGDYVNGIYTDVPKGILIAMVAAIMYLLSPFDILTDFIPITGWMDDLAVITLVMKMGGDVELAKYRSWRSARDAEEEVKKAEQALGEVIEGLDPEEKVLAVFAIDNSRLEILSTVVSDVRKPIPCRAHILTVSGTELKGKEILEVYNKALGRMNIRWSELGRIGIRYEQEYESFAEDFEVMA